MTLREALMREQVDHVSPSTPLSLRLNQVSFITNIESMGPTPMPVIISSFFISFFLCLFQITLSAFWLSN